MSKEILEESMNKIHQWVHNNPLKYHMYTKIPLVLFVLYVISEVS